MRSDGNKSEFYTLKAEEFWNEGEGFTSHINCEGAKAVAISGQTTDVWFNNIKKPIITEGADIGVPTWGNNMPKFPLPVMNSRFWLTTETTDHLTFFGEFNGGDRIRIWVVR